jgi:hypothetical protein
VKEEVRVRERERERERKRERKWEVWAGLDKKCYGRRGIHSLSDDVPHVPSSSSIVVQTHSHVTPPYTGRVRSGKVSWERAGGEREGTKEGVTERKCKVMKDDLEEGKKGRSPSNSLFQCSIVESGTAIRKGPLICSTSKRWSRKVTTCTVLPRPRERMGVGPDGLERMGYETESVEYVFG